ncbi:MAG: hypothetical protein KDB47_04670 [Mycobacterium sp.]|nr:hypothetical protein [Mycobacterium sp.]
MSEQTNEAPEATEAPEAEALDGAAEAPESAVEPSGGTTEVDSATEANESVSRRDQKLADEAAKWRVTARQTETRLKVAEARIEELQRAEINRQLATKLEAPEDFWLATNRTLADLLNEDGQVDTERVAEAAEAVLANRSHWRAKLKPVGAPADSVTGDGKYEPPKTVTWHSLLQGNAG